jgi:hypothetical protein
MASNKSRFKKPKNAFFPTPREAVLPLLPHLGKSTTFIEPCAGAGDLIRHLESFGHDCCGAADIAPQESPDYEVFISKMDALQFCHQVAADLGSDFEEIEFIITNPPFGREFNKTLKRLIEGFAHIKPTWLLLPAGFAYNKTSAPFLQYCQAIVAIGRIRWFEGTKDKEGRDSAWFLFDKNQTRKPALPIKFYPLNENKVEIAQ